MASRDPERPRLQLLCITCGALRPRFIIPSTAPRRPTVDDLARALVLQTLKETPHA